MRVTNCSRKKRGTGAWRLFSVTEGVHRITGECNISVMNGNLGILKITF